jgi:hypothetical protein
LQQRVLKAKVWAIVEAFTFVLNCVVTIYVMNQSQRQWLLFDVLNTCINLTLTLEVEVGQAIDVFDALDAFDAKLIIFLNNMRA